MMRVRHSGFVLGCWLWVAPHSVAQTYTPKHIRVEGPAGIDPADILRMAGLKEGTPLTKEQIETALQRLGDTGAFADLGYTVNGDALVLKLTGSPAARVLPVRYSNFVWWKPEELTPQIQARVPLYQGKLPLTGNLTEQVEAALVAMLKEKGIDGSVTMIEGSGGKMLTLSVARPEILLGEVKVEGSLPGVAKLLAQMQHGFAGQDFDVQQTATAIPRNVTDLYENAGYLDAATDKPVFTGPRKDLDHYVMDAVTTVHPGEVYRIRTLRFEGAPAGTGDLEKVAGVKAGDPAGVFPLQHAADAVAHAFTRRGYLDAVAHETHPRDAAAHTVDCTITVAAGEVYHLAELDITALPPEMQAQFARVSKARTGAVSGDASTGEVARALMEIKATGLVRMKAEHDAATHTERIALTLVGRR